MLSLQIDGQYCDLGDGFSFTMNLKSPIFSSDIGSASYPFKIPYTERNARLLGFLHRVENTGDVYQTRQGTFLWNDKILFSGTLKMKVLNSKSFEGALYEGSGNFIYLKKNTLLRDLLPAKLHFANNTAVLAWIASCYDKYYPEVVVAFPQIANDAYFEETPTDPQLLYFNYQDDSGNITIKTAQNNNTVIVPFLYLRYVINQVFTNLGYTIDPIDDYFASDPVFNKLVIFNSLSINNHCLDFSYPPTDVFYKMHVPAITLNDFLSAIEKFFNVRFIVNDMIKTVKIKSVSSAINNGNYIDFNSCVISKSRELEEQFTGCLMECKNDSGDDALTTILANNDSDLERMKEEVEFITQLPAWPDAEIHELRYVTSKQAHYQLHPANNPYWGTTNPSIFSRRPYHNKEINYDLGMSSLGTVNTITFHEWPVICKNKLTEWNKTTLRTFFVNNRPYQGISDNKMRGYCIDENFSLWLQDPNLGITPYSLFYNCHKSFLEFKLATSLVKATKQMTIMDLMEFDFYPKRMIGGTKYLIKSVQVNFKTDQIMPALIECYICN